MFHSVDEVLFNAFTTRCQMTDVVDVDARLLEAIAFMNQIPGVATVFSCSGHTAEERDNISNDHRAWIQFVVKAGYPQFFEGYQNTLSELKAVNPTLTLKAVQKYIPPDVDGMAFNIYNCWVIEVKGSPEGIIEHAAFLTDIVKNIYEYCKE